MAGELEGARVLLGVTGGIAAYKAALVARLLVGAGAQVDPVLTHGASRFLGTATLEGLTGRPVRDDVWADIPGETHVALGRAADVALIYPATAHALARMAAGLADDLLTTTLLAARCPVVVCPAMHTEMWQHAATQANVATLLGRGVTVLGPDDGRLMGGDQGPGRVVEPEEALEAVAAALASVGPRVHDLDGRVVVVTAAGTREAIDPVRFLGNRATGRMGFAVADAARRRGATVHLVTGPTALATPPGVTRHDIVSARDLQAAVTGLRDQADVIVKAAAVADFRPGSTSEHKLKKDAGVPALELVRNPDVLAELGAWRGERTHPVLVGFAAETTDIDRNAAAKLARKRIDLLVVNDVSRPDAGFGAVTNEVTILGVDGSRDEVALDTKAAVAHRVLDAVVSRLA